MIKKPIVKRPFMFPIMQLRLFHLMIAFLFFNSSTANNVTKSKIHEKFPAKDNSKKKVEDIFFPIIKGKVTDVKGNPLPGATVLAKGTKFAVLTDIDGNFTIDMPKDVKRLIISYIGMDTKEIGTDNSSPIIVLNELGENLKEVIVTTGYEKTSKRTFAGATSKIAEKDLKVDGFVDISRMIEGKAAGVTVQNVTGTFGSAPKITVRGSSSIFGDTKPLWVIDGVVQEDIVNYSFADLTSGNSESLLSSSIAGLNANDIQSIEILKDASATAIYGSRSMNGVIVVTTKQGRKNSPLKVSYSLEQTLRTVPTYNQYDILNSQESMSIFKEMESKGFLTLGRSVFGKDGGVYNVLGKALTTYSVDTQKYGVDNNPVSRNQFLKKYETANTDWFKVLFRPSITQNHSLSFSGGGQNSTFYASLALFSDPGATIAENVKQLSSNIKGTFYLNEKLNLTLSTMASIRDQNAPGTYDSKEDIVSGRVTRDFDINPFNYALNTNRTLRPRDESGNLEYYRNNWAPINIINELKNNYMELQVKDIRFQLDLDYKINTHLSYNFTGSSRYVNTNREHKILENSNIVGAYNAGVGKTINTVTSVSNPFLYKDTNDPIALKESALTDGGILRKFTNQLLSYNVRNSVNYKNIFNDKHEIEVFFGTELRSVDRSSDNFTASGVKYERGLAANPDPKFVEKIIDEGESYFDFSEEKERTVGFFGKVGYTFDRRFTASITGRYDGSNRQGKNNSWLPTYTFSGIWNVSEENFIKNLSSVTNLRIRGSYGLTATSGPASNSLIIYKSDKSKRLLFSDREPEIRISDLQNTDLTWEKQFETNLGIDFGMFNNRLQITTDVFNRKAFDLVDNVLTTGIGGQNIKQGNNANMDTNGIELTFTTQNIVTNNFRWSSSFNFLIFDQKITKLMNTPNAFNLVNGNGGNTLGKPRNSLYSYQFTGLNNHGLPTFILHPEAVNNVTSVDFQALTNVIGYLKYEGSVEPNKTMGIANTFSYKNWTLYAQLVGSAGNKIRLDSSYRGEYSDLDVFAKRFSNRWINPGDENYTNIPVIADKRLIANYGGQHEISKAYNTYNYSNIRVVDGDFLRLKNISLAWEFPADFKKKIGVNTFSLRGSAVNPWLIYSDKRLNGKDPEFRNTGGVALPISSQYSFAINLSL